MSVFIYIMYIDIFKIATISQIQISVEQMIA